MTTKTNPIARRGDDTPAYLTPPPTAPGGRPLGQRTAGGGGIRGVREICGQAGPMWTTRRSPSKRVAGSRGFVL